MAKKSDTKTLRPLCRHDHFSDESLLDGKCLFVPSHPLTCPL